MEYRKGPAGKPLSALGFGCMRFERKSGSVDLDAAQALRYMGCTQKADPSTEALLQKAEALLRPAAQPHAVWMECPVAELPLQNTGSDLARHLQGCENAVLLAVTLGSGTDRLLQRLSATELPAAVAADAAASTLIEQLCD